MAAFIVAVLSVATLVVAYLGYRAQLRQSYKRLHYSSFMTALVLPRFGDAADSIKVHQGPEELICPVLCVARIENTGRAAIPPSDFSGPLTIRPKGLALFRCGEVSWNRPDILDPRRPKNVDVNIGNSEFSIHPTLLNPNDSITVAYVADVIPEKWELEVSGRIAGIEEVIRVPTPTHDSTSCTGTGKSLSSTIDATLDRSASPSFSVLAFVSPILASPPKMFSGQLDVFVDSDCIADAHLATITITNEGSAHVQSGLEYSLTGKVAESSIKKRYSIAIYDAAGAERTSPEHVGLTADFTAHCILIKFANLEPGWTIAANFYTSGNCGDLAIGTHGFSLSNATLMHLDTDGIIEANLAQVKPRLLLTNQLLYKQWHAIATRYPWLGPALAEELKSAKDAIRAFLGVD
jgi:hypothetical protein